MIDLSKTGLPAKSIEKIQHVFSHYSEIQQVILYGSRAKGTYRRGSDIDMTVMGDELSGAALLQLEVELDDLLLPYKIDLSLFRQISNVALKEHIERVGVEFYNVKIDFPVR
ncbi:MAG: nucleotidyltransferase domain-containing protein [Gammaproteobacteria bacterium]|nr:nucleotidyltransferase domain-containing protein [Gammaproteobacteria bacterium]